MKRYFITGIGTDVGKTLISAILVEVLQADYWKPIQSGDLNYTDTMKVRALVSNEKSQFYQESYLLTKPLSPHSAAKFDNIQISLDKIECPNSNNSLIVEGAGGLLVPINDSGEMMKDIMIKLAFPVVVVVRNYLGSINHTLLTVEVLQKYGIKIGGLVFNGEKNEDSERIILETTQLPCILNVDEEPIINKETVAKYANLVKLDLI